MSNITRTIGTATTAVIDAFRVEHAAAANTDTALRDLFDAVYTDSRSQTRVIADAKAAATGLDAFERSVRCLPTQPYTATACSIVGEALSSYHDDMEGMFNLREAWAITAAIANEKKHGGGKPALVDLFASDAETLSEWVARLDRLFAAVNAARRKAEATPKPPVSDSSDGESDNESDGESESSESESSPSSANRWASVLAVLTALAADASGMTEADMAAHAQATAILAEMVPASTTPSSPAGIEIVFPDVFVPA